MKTVPVWQTDAPSVGFARLDAPLEVDVAIIGGGITGITCGHLMTRAGLEVAVFEARAVGSGTTGASTGNLYASVDHTFDALVTKHGAETVRAVATSRTAAVDLIASLVHEHALACDFQRVPWFRIAETVADEDFIHNEHVAADAAGLFASFVPGKDVPLAFPIQRALRIEQQAQLNPWRYVRALATAAAEGGCRIFEHAKVLAWDPPEKSESPDGYFTLTIETGPNPIRVRARDVVMATHTPKGHMGVQMLLGPYREYAIAARLASGSYPPPGTYWLIENGERHSLRTFRNARGEERLMVLGEPHKVGQGGDHVPSIARLEAYLRKRFDLAEVEYRWGAQHYRPADGLPYIGPEGHDGHLLIATGFSTDGLVYGTLAAMVLTDHLLGRDNLWAATYRFMRHTPIKSAAAWIKENANVAVQYLKDVPGHVDAKHFAELARGDGKTIEIDGRKCGAFRDDAGALHIVSAVCTHMAGIVSWNRVERTWDCPCHGSRFGIDGAVIEGPAIVDLPCFSAAEVADARHKDQGGGT